MLGKTNAHALYGEKHGQPHEMIHFDDVDFKMIYAHTLAIADWSGLTQFVYALCGLRRCSVVSVKLY